MSGKGDKPEAQKDGSIGKYTWLGELKEEDTKDIQTSSGYKIKCLIYDGLNFPVLMLNNAYIPDVRTNLPRIRTMDIRDDDILICAYAKAGTQWLWELTSMLVKGTPEYEKCPKTQDMLEFREPKDLETTPSPRILNTHLLFRHIPKKIVEKRCKIVFLQRNPKDVAVSLFFHKKNLEKDDLKWEDHLELFPTADMMPYTDWYTYTLDWERVPSEYPDLPIHCIYYEDLKKDMHSESKKMAKFLEVDRDDQLIEEITKRCSFQNMKTGASEKMSIHNPGVKETRYVPLFRKGKTGDWKNYFTVAQNERFDEEYKQRMKDSKFKFTYEL